MCETYNYDYLQRSIFRFNFIDFQLNTDFPSQFLFCFVLFFTVKSTSVTERSVFQENALKNSKHPSPFFRRTIGSNKSFTLIEDNFWFLR